MELAKKVASLSNLHLYTVNNKKRTSVMSYYLKQGCHITVMRAAIITGFCNISMKYIYIQEIKTKIIYMMHGKPENLV